MKVKRKPMIRAPNPIAKAMAASPMRAQNLNPNKKVYSRKGRKTQREYPIVG